jgi:ABC-type multidrug transport system fused ATPase/permease subunit
LAAGTSDFLPWTFVIPLPDAVLVTPDLRSPTRYLMRLARQQWRTLALGIGVGVVWMVSNALVPAVLGRTIDAGVIAKDGGALVAGCLVLLGLTVVQATTGVIRHRLAVQNWLLSAIRSSQLVGHHVADHGPAVAATATTGEVVSVLTSDASRIGEVYDVSARLAGAVASSVLVAVLVLRIDEWLGLTVLIGLPALIATLVVVVRPLQARQAERREAEGRLTALGADTAAGLRVLRGIGGEPQFLRRYNEHSDEVRLAGVRVAGIQATLDAAHVALPGAFIVLLTWLGAREAITGRITPGELVTLYGYAAFLVIPLTTATEALGKAVRAKVGAGRLVALLRVRPAHLEAPSGDEPVPRRPMPPANSPVVDPASGLTVQPGMLTAVVSPQPEQAAALADRLTRLEDDLPAGDGQAARRELPPALLGTVPITALPLDELRARILVNDAEPRLFTGTLRDELDPRGGHTDARILQAMHVADAADVLDAVPYGLDGVVEERGRSFSGGQRQRIALARVLLADPEVLVLVEPTSSVDAHTEARIARRLRAARAGRTTVVATASPLMLDHVDRVAFLLDGEVAAEGSHHELLHTHPAYRDTVLRGEDT